MLKTTVAKFSILIIILTAALGVNYLFAAWVGPTQAPPLGNTPTPIHIGATDQVKEGGLSVDGLSVFGGGYFQGNVIINALIPSTGGEQDLNLDVEGAVGAQYYCDEGGNNCASAPLGGGGADSDWTVNVNDMYSGVSGNVGIGASSPAAKLHVSGNIIANDPIANNHVATRGWVNAQVGGGSDSYTRMCSWSAYSTAWLAASSCSPPGCYSGYTSRGVDCYPTTLSIWSWSSGGVPRWNAQSGVCHRICIK